MEKSFLTVQDIHTKQSVLMASLQHGGVASLLGTLTKVPLITSLVACTSLRQGMQIPIHTSGAEVIYVIIYLFRSTSATVNELIRKYVLLDELCTSLPTIDTLSHNTSYHQHNQSITES